MTPIVSTAINNDIPTTFQRFLNGSSINERNKSLTKLGREDLEFKRKYSDKNIMVHTIFTNFELETLEPKWEKKESIFPGDLDFYTPLKPKKSFVIKAKVVSVAKFRPKPFFE